MAEELGEKTEEPTPHRMNKARDEGQVAWSKDFASFVVLCSGTIALMLLAMLGTGLLKDWLAFGLNRAHWGVRRWVAQLPGCRPWVRDSGFPGGWSGHVVGGRRRLFAGWLPANDQNHWIQA